MKGEAQDWYDRLARRDPVRADCSRGVFTAYPSDPRFQLIARRRLDRGDPHPEPEFGKQATFSVAELDEARRLFGREISHRDPYGD